VKSCEINEIKLSDSYEKLIGPTIRNMYDSFWFGHHFAVILSNPEDIKIAMNSDKCFEKHPTYEFYFKYGLLSIGGDKYRAQKKCLNPLFSPSNLRTLIPIINKHTGTFLNENADHMEHGEFEMRSLVAKFSLNTIMNTLIGIDRNILPDDILKEMIEKADIFMTTSSARIFQWWIHPKFIFKFTKIYRHKKYHFKKILDVMNEFLDDTDAKNIDGITFFRCMKNLLTSMDYEEYSETIALFLGAAYETTAGTISATLLFLALNPEKQEILYNELSSIMSSHEDEPDENMLNKMNYLYIVLK